MFNFSHFFLFSFFFLLTQPSLALTRISTPGRYDVIGYVSAAKSKSLELKVDAGTRSAVQLSLLMDQATRFKVGDIIKASVMIKKKGIVQNRDAFLCECAAIYSQKGIFESWSKAQGSCP